MSKNTALKIVLVVMAFCVVVGIFAVVMATRMRLPELATIRENTETGFAHAGWDLDRYKDIETLEAHSSMVVADLKGPGVIRYIHTSRHHPAELFARGIVLEIWFDNAAEPAVMCPLADFFGDGCNGRSMDFSSNLVECAPWNYSCYIPMPFRERAVVILRNDTDRRTDNYSYVEWESLPRWNSKLGYFHATYGRDLFQLTRTASHRFIDIRGKGHFIGRQMSVNSDDPVWNGVFSYVMEGNNEVAIDGRERAIDYLGTENSFTFSWGFQKTFAGPHAGMPYIQTGDTIRLSIYRFHDHMPIRFRKSLTWDINWEYERHFNNNDPQERVRADAEILGRKWEEAEARGGCWIDYAYVFYWYQDSPGGYTHKELAPLAERGKVLLKSNRSE